MKTLQGTLVTAAAVALLWCKENAVILMLCRNSDLKNAVQSLEYFEDTFNRTYGYPYVFLNDVEFTEEFKDGVSKVISTTAEFGKLSPEEWGFPPWIDKQKVDQSRERLEREGIIYGGSLSYRHMCRFFSGFFYKNALVKRYDYYWRIEPGVKFFCTMNYDPFTFLREKKKDYGFVITIREYMQTIPTLWESTIEFLGLHRHLIKTESLKFMFDGASSYNGCHFWSNFEIASFNFFRSALYEKYFEFLDRKGGFYYERWGDAPVHSLAAALFLGRDRVHFFEDIGYEHPPFTHCPRSPSRLVSCKCKAEASIDNNPFSCLKEFLIETQFV
eukprot:jgi/Antlo1/2058/644